MRAGPDTSTGGMESEFPKTDWNLVADPSSTDENTRRRGLERLLRVYWRPMYKHVRIRWGKPNEQTKDLIQEFCLALLDGAFVEKYQPQLGRFRTFVRISLDNFVRNEHRDRSRLKRGGGKPIFSLDAATEEDPGDSIEDSRARDPATAFDEEWDQALMDTAIIRLEHEFVTKKKQQYLDVFREFEERLQSDERPPYAEIATKFGISESDVSNYIQAVKRALRRTVQDLVRESVTDEESYTTEMSRLTGME